MCKDSLFFLYHIRDACVFIIKALPETKEGLQSDEITFFAIVKKLEIIGEATKNITADIKYQWRSIEWKKMAGMRNRLTHEYWGISYDVVWGTAKDIIPVLLEQIKEVIGQEEKQRTLKK